ncbi:MAG: hypothetical protein AAB036_00800 [Elusimicrobiota bacterium]
MITLLLSACLLCLSAANAVASSDEIFAQSLQPAGMVADNRYKLTEKKAAQALDLLKILRDYSNDVKKGAVSLGDAMHDTYYEDWINTKLLPFISEADSAYELVNKTYSLEKDHVNLDLKTAKGGDYAPIERTMARMAAFGKSFEARVKANEANVEGVRKQYEYHYGLAKTALAQFQKLPLVKELLSAKPPLVKEIVLATASMRPLVWRLEFIKLSADYNDPRYAQLPKSISIPDGAETATYQVLIR